jgi:hypothetical protein
MAARSLVNMDLGRREAEFVVGRYAGGTEDGHPVSLA